MKKIMVLVSALGLVTVAAQAQNGRDAQFMGECLKGLCQQSTTKETVSAGAQAAGSAAAAVASSAVATVTAYAEKVGALRAQATNEAKEAEAHFEVLIKFNEKFQAPLKRIARHHNDLVTILQKEGKPDFVYQEAYEKLEVLAKSVKQLNYPPLIQKVRETLNHNYYFPIYEQKLVSLSAVAAHVEDEASTLANGMLQVQYGDFYKDLYSYR